jgi:putative membrane protein
MFRLMIQWLLSAVALMFVSRIVPGFSVKGLIPALLASVAIGFLNATLGFMLKVITFPLSILSFGIFLLVINAAMIRMASSVVPGFRVTGWAPAFWGAVVLSILGLLVRMFAHD